VAQLATFNDATALRAYCLEHASATPNLTADVRSAAGLARVHDRAAAPGAHAAEREAGAEMETKPMTWLAEAVVLGMFA
jgi:hypothetical protein